MKLVSLRTGVALVIAAAPGAFALIAACSSSSGTPSGSDYSSGSNASSGTGAASGSSTSGASSGGSGDDGGSSTEPFADATVAMYDGPPPNVDGGKLLCATPDGLPIQFNPMYSGFDGTHTYQIPTFVMGVDPASVTWGSSDPSMVMFQPYVTGIMITTMKAGDVTIVATVGGDGGTDGGATCGTAALHITQYTADQWNTGSARYNNGIGLQFDASAIMQVIKSCDASLPLPPGFDGSFDGNFAGFDGNFPPGFDGSIPGDVDGSGMSAFLACLGNPFDNPPAACTNCHGDVGNGKLFGMSLYTDVSHTPEQTGGFSDQDLVNVFVNGVVPPGGYFDPSITSYATWHDFHRWADISTTDEQAGMTAFLRSLAPKEQLGCADLFQKGGPGCADAGH